MIILGLLFFMKGVSCLLDYLDDKGLLLLLQDLKEIQEKTWPNVIYIREDELDGMIMMIKSMIRRSK